MSTSQRSETVRRFVRDRFPGCKRQDIAGDASGRRFLRVFQEDGASLVIMDYGCTFCGETDDMILAGIFLRAGLPVARVLEAVPDPGILVLEDLGDATLEDRLGRRPGEAGTLYGAAVDLAARIALEGTAELNRSTRRNSPALDQERFRFEMEYFLQHYYCGFLGHSLETTQSHPLREFLLSLADRAAGIEPKVLCHRDFHSRNLVVSEGGRLSMVDIQDARRGPLGYDLASLLWDAYVDLDPEGRAVLIRRFLARVAAPDNFQENLKALALQRMIKALGTFGYQIAVLGKKRYLSAIPRTLKNIADLGHNIAILEQIIGYNSE